MKTLFKILRIIGDVKSVGNGTYGKRVTKRAVRRPINRSINKMFK